MSEIICVTNRGLCENDNFLTRIEKIARCMPHAIVLREKDMAGEEYELLAKEVIKICEKYNVTCILHYFKETAKKLKVKALHLPLYILREMTKEERAEFTVLGASCHSVEEAMEAQSLGCTYIFAGHVFETDCKRGAAPRGISFIKDVCKSVDIPVYAIGGINQENISEVEAAGAKGGCIMSGFMRCPDVEKYMKAFAEKNINTVKTALTIAGSDTSGGAGIQADIKTMTCNGVYAMSAVTALTAQNTMGITGIMEVTPEFLAKQLDAVFGDIFPDAVKIGMLSSEALITVTAQKLEKYNAKNIVLDPVLISTSGTRLLDEGAMNTLRSRLFPLASVVTPNIPEAQVLSDIRINSKEDMIKAAEKISRRYDCAVLCKGGHSKGEADDLLYHDGQYMWYRQKRIDNPNTHGTGCTLSSAIASNLAKGYDIETSVRMAKDYMTRLLNIKVKLGNGNGPLFHVHVD